LWKSFERELKREFWKELIFWSDGYFICSIDNVSEKTIRRYIDEQGFSPVEHYKEGGRKMKQFICKKSIEVKLNITFKEVSKIKIIL